MAPNANPRPVTSAGQVTGFPEWGFNQAGKVIEVRNEQAKLQAMNQGYLDWFSTKAEAQNAFKGMQGELGTGAIPSPLSGVNAIGDLASRLTEGNTWVRVAEFIAGSILLYVAVKAMFPGAVGTVKSTAKKAGALAAFT